MNKKIKHVDISELERELFESQRNALYMRLQRLAEDYAQLYDSYGKGLAEMGEKLLQHADFLQQHRDNAEDISWNGLIRELMRRSG